MAKNIPPEPPYRWQPLGTQGRSRPPVGTFLAWRHAAWRVVEVKPVPEIEWNDEERGYLGRLKPQFAATRIPLMVVIRPARITADDPRSRDYDVHLRVAPQSFRAFDIYASDHYPVCSECGDPVPCREEMARTIGEKAEKDAARFEIGGVCPACQEIPTARHKVMTFEENLRVPFGPPVTFHVGRRACRWQAAEYEQRIAEMTPRYRTVLSCPGDVWKHVDGAECSEGDDCRGLKVQHGHVSGCDSRCLRCKDARAAQRDEITARNAAGDWTSW